MTLPKGTTLIWGKGQRKSRKKIQRLFSGRKNFEDRPPGKKIQKNLLANLILKANKKLALVPSGAVYGPTVNSPMIQWSEMYNI